MALIVLIAVTLLIVQFSSIEATGNSIDNANVHKLLDRNVRKSSGTNATQSPLDWIRQWCSICDKIIQELKNITFTVYEPQSKNPKKKEKYEKEKTMKDEPINSGVGINKRGINNYINGEGIDSKNGDATGGVNRVRPSEALTNYL